MKCVALVAVLVAGCSPGVPGASGITQGDCTLDIVVTGGYEWATATTPDARLGCTETNAEAFGLRLTVSAYGPGDGVLREVHLDFSRPLQPGETGVVGTTVVVYAQDETVAIAQWTSATNACEVSVERNVAADTDLFLVGGFVSCGDQLLSPTEVSYPPPIMVGEFEFQTGERLP